MKRNVLLLLLALSSCISISYSQAKKPTLMVVPSDRYCIEHRYTTNFESMGDTLTIPNYKKALQSDENLRLVISEMGRIMVDRGFPLKDLETSLKNIQTEEVEVEVISGRQGGRVMETPIDLLKRTAKADIILDLDFSINEGDLGMKYINFNLKGIDAYTSKIIAATTGSGKPYMTSQVTLLLKMAVKDHLDGFNAQLSSYFEDMFEKGREISAYIKVFDTASLSFYDTYDCPDYDMEDELNYLVEEYFARHTVNGRFSIEDVTEYTMKLSQIRMPLLDQKGRALDARRYLSDLRKFLAAPPFNIDSKIYTKGLGEAWLILGEK